MCDVIFTVAQRSLARGQLRTRMGQPHGDLQRRGAVIVAIVVLAAVESVRDMYVVRYW
jgi:hypothetical protein